MLLAHDGLFRLLGFATFFSLLTLEAIPWLSKLAPLLTALYLFGCAVLQSKLPRFILQVATYSFILTALVLALSLTRSNFDLSKFIVFVSRWASVVVLLHCASTEKGAYALFWSASLASLVNILAVLVGFDSWVEFGPKDLTTGIPDEVLRRRPNGLIGNANLMALQSMLPLVMVWVYRLKVSRKILWAIFLTAVYSVAVTGSRKGLVILLLISFVVFGRQLAIGSYTVRLAKIIACFLLMSFVFPLILNLGEDFVIIERVQGASLRTDGSINDRIFLASEGIRLIEDSFLFGYGFDSFRQLNKLGLYSHNNLIEMFVTGGVLLFSYYFAIYIYLFMLTLRNKHYKHGFIFLVGAIFLENSMVVYTSTWVLFLLFSQISRLVNRRSG